MLRQHGVRTEDGLLPRFLLPARPDLREQPVLVVDAPGLAAG
jgi:hypothetical protein